MSEVSHTVRPGVRLDSLTGLRFFAALGVAVCHLVALMGITGAASGLLLFWQYGVDFFFILSGFVLTWSWRPSRSARRFYWLRFARIWPIHLFVLALLFALGVRGRAPDVVRQILLVNQWLPLSGTHQGLNPVTWTLSVEVVFYLVFPWIIGPARRASSRALGVVTCALWIAAAAWASGSEHVLHVRSAWWREGCPLLWLPEFFIGMLIALLLQRHTMTRNIERTCKIAGAVSLGLALALFVGVNRGAIPQRAVPSWPFVVDMPFALLIAGFAMGDLRGGVRCPRWLVVLGEWSFALYLVHRDAVFYRLWPHLGALPSPVAVAILLVTAIAVSGMVYVAVERPVERWLRARGPRDKLVHT